MIMSPKWWSAALAAAALSAPALAADFPAKPLNIVVGTPPGGAVDTYARIVADGVSQELGETAVVENRSGANGNIAAQAVLQQPADGHTLWVGTQAMVEINPAAFQQLPWAPEDFTPIIRGIQAPLVLVAHPSVPADTLDELLAWLKENPGTGYASFSPGTPSHFLGYQFSETQDLDMVHVPYRGSAPQVTDLVGGHTLLGFSQIQTSLPMIQEGKLKPIVTTGPERSRYLPDTPTLQELGYPELNTTIWFGMMVNSDTPDEVKQRLTEVMAKVHGDPAIQEKLEAAGYDVSGETGASFAQSIEQGRQRWAELVEASGFEAAN